MLELKNITAGYGKQTVLNNITVTFKKGQLTGIVGVNGCGKSTLLKSTLGILPVSQGTIEIDGKNLSLMSRQEVAKKIAYLSQIRSTPDMTVEQMVLHGRFPHLSYPRRYTDQDKKIALNAMKAVGISAFANKPLYALSGGMLQNAFIAMALAQDTDYILMDEPTTHLDIGNSIKLMSILKELTHKGKGIVAVLHDISLALEYADHIIVINNGEAVMCDSAINVFKSGIIDEIFDVKIHNADTSYYYEKRN